MTNNEVWQRMLSLESRDATTRWFAQIHGLELNARRAKEITAAAKQAREFFRNAGESDYSVRPLLTFYGVACLSRALLLLLRARGGEEGLNAGHGLETVNWSGVISGDVGDALKSLPNLRIRTAGGLFTEFVNQTNNRVSIHTNSASVDWSISYDVPVAGIEITLGELCSRLPDLKSDYEAAGGHPLYAVANQVSFNQNEGFRATLSGEQPESLKEFFLANGYTGIVTADAKTFSEHLPMFIHTYVHKMFGTIPKLYLARPFGNGICYSQLAVTYMMAYILGMLARYYPTHWISLTQGGKGDIWWPTLNRAQHLVESSYPELVVELIHDVLQGSKRGQVWAAEGVRQPKGSGSRRGQSNDSSAAEGVRQPKGSVQ